MMAVADTGAGMTPEVQAQMFEPFFTTKDVSKGTGLGLSTVYGIVKQSGGYIGVHSELHHGTRLEIYLPQAEEGTAREAAPRVQNVESAEGDETILVVEDEPMIREMLCESLKEFGYTVLDAGSAAEATARSEAHTGPIALLMTDIVLPGESGRELAAALVKRRPDMKVLFMSGYTDDAVVRRGVLTAGVAFLQKPFTLVGMAHKIREALITPAAERDGSTARR
jgi:CheY-like chemotaxis protein